MLYIYIYTYIYIYIYILFVFTSWPQDEKSHAGDLVKILKDAGGALWIWREGGEVEMGGRERCSQLLRNTQKENATQSKQCTFDPLLMQSGAWHRAACRLRSGRPANRLRQRLAQGGGNFHPYVFRPQQLFTRPVCMQENRGAVAKNVRQATEERDSE